MWRLWCKALGEKATNDDREADNIAHIRTIIFLTYLVTNLFICAGVVRHWNDVDIQSKNQYNKCELNTNYGTR